MTLARKKKLTLAALLPALLFSALSPATAAAQEKAKKKKPAPRGVPVLWRAPGDISARDTFDGPGGDALRPDLRRVDFIREQKGGWSPKMRVRDAAGREWVAKFGKEAQSEAAAVRLVWAVGYVTEINYLVPCVQIVGVPKPPKDAERCPDGGFANVRFELRPKNVKRLDPWQWEKNPFTGTKELQGLKTLMVLINNWDIKDSNNVVFHTQHNGRSELQYVISDLGATFGKTGGLSVFWRVTRSRNDPEGFSHDKFIEGVRDDGRVNFEFAGKNTGLFKDITVEHARWIGRLLAQLTDRQLHDIFRAANYTPEEIGILSAAVRRRIDQLVSLSR